MKSLSLLLYKPEEPHLEVRARDYSANWMTAVAMLDDDVYLGAENSYNLFTARKNNDDALDDNRTRLEVRPPAPSCVRGMRHRSAWVVLLCGKLCWWVWRCAVLSLPDSDQADGIFWAGTAREQLLDALGPHCSQNLVMLKSSGDNGGMQLHSLCNCMTLPWLLTARWAFPIPGPTPHINHPPPCMPTRACRWRGRTTWGSLSTACSMAPWS